LAFGRPKLDWPASMESNTQIVSLLDSGALDTAIDRCSPAPDSGRSPRRYVDSTEFSHEDWMKRHGLDR